jgi:hypothetical protein
MQKHLTTFLLLLLPLAAWAQPKQNSPYSRYGLGDPAPQYFAAQAAQGGLSAAFHDPYHLNILNPASFAFLRTTALEGALFANYSHYVNTADQNTLDDWTGNLAYFALGFTLKSPINEALDRSQSPWQVGMGVSLTPYTNVGYNIETVTTGEEIGRVTNSFEGTGGTYRLGWSTGVKYRRTALGLNLGWMFGKAIYENTTIFEDSLPTFINNFRDELKVNGLVWSLGLQHDFVLRYQENNRDVPTRWITVGLTGETQHDVRALLNRVYIRSRGRTAAGQYILPDTISFISGGNQSVTLPSTFGAGFQYVEANRLKIGAQAQLENWSNYRNEARPDTLNNTFSVAVGLEYIPDFASYNNYLRRVRYRLGGYFRQDPRPANGAEALSDVGLTFGFGFPLILPRQQTSFLNTAFELGKLGAGSPIERTYVRITLGFTLNDNSWFYKRRFE